MHKFWTSYSKAILALGFSFGLMLLFKWLGVLVYDTNDDTIMAAISYGYYGVPQAGLVYIHPWLGALLAALQRAVPGLSWYLLMEMGILGISMAVLVRLYLEQTHGGQAVLGLTVFGLLFVYTMLFSLQYTKIAGISTASGILLLFYAVREGHGPGAYILGLLLALLGLCLRSAAFFMVLIPLAGVGAACLLSQLRQGGIRQGVKLVGVFAVLFALCGGLLWGQNRFYASDPQWAAYQRFNALRTELMDYGFPDYGENQAVYASLGISEEDLALYKSWDFADPEIFNAEAMQTLVDAKPKTTFSFQRLLQCGKGAVQGLVRYDFFACVWLAAGLWLLTADKKRLLLGLYALAALVATETYLLYAGRGLRERVDGALVLTVAVILLLCTRQAERKLLEPRVCGILAAAVILSQTPSLFARKDAAMERYIGAAHIQAAYRELSEDKQTLYYFRTDELPPDRLPGRQGDFGYYSNIAVLGGWLTESPYVKQRDQAFGVRNPFRDMVDAENIRLVSNDPEPVLAYIRAHYAENAQLVQVGQARGEYSIWRIQTVQ